MMFLEPSEASKHPNFGFEVAKGTPKLVFFLKLILHLNSEHLLLCFVMHTLYDKLCATADIFCKISFPTF